MCGCFGFRRIYLKLMVQVVGLLMSPPPSPSKVIQCRQGEFNCEIIVLSLGRSYDLRGRGQGQHAVCGGQNAVVQLNMSLKWREFAEVSLCSSGVAVVVLVLTTIFNGRLCVI